MNILIVSVASVTYVALGFSLPVIANQTALAITKNQLSNQTDPKKMLGVFYKSQTLKLVFFTIICLAVMLTTKHHGTEIIFGVMSNTIYKRFTNKRKEHEPHQSYSN